MFAGPGAATSSAWTTRAAMSAQQSLDTTLTERKRFHNQTPQRLAACTSPPPSPPHPLRPALRPELQLADQAACLASLCLCQRLQQPRAAAARKGRAGGHLSHHMRPAACSLAASVAILASLSLTSCSSLRTLVSRICGMGAGGGRGAERLLLRGACLATGRAAQPSYHEQQSSLADPLQQPSHPRGQSSPARPHLVGLPQLLDRQVPLHQRLGRRGLPGGVAR